MKDITTKNFAINELCTIKYGISDLLYRLKLLFSRYTPQSIELENKLKPFIPDFIPAVGDIDAFVKVCLCSCFFFSLVPLRRVFLYKTIPKI